MYWHLSGRVNFTGEVKESVISLSPGLSGTFSRIEVGEGQRVRKGQPLMTLDSTAQRRALAEEQQKLAQLEALLSPQHARTPGSGAYGQAPDDESLEQRLDRQRKEEAAAERRLQNAADYEAQAAIVYNRAALLTSQGKLATRERDAAAALEDARLATQNAKVAFESLSLARSGTVAEIRRVKENQNAIGADTLPANLRIKNYELQRERARAAAAELEATVLRAPEDGLVTEITARPGGPAVAGVPCIYIAPLDKAATVVAQISDDAAEKLRLGQRCRLEIVGAPENPFTGYISGFLPKSSLSADKSVDTPAAPGVRVQVTIIGMDTEEPAATEKTVENGMSVPYLPGGTQADVTVFLRKPLFAENEQAKPLTDMPPASGKTAPEVAPAAAPALPPTIAPTTAQLAAGSKEDKSGIGAGGTRPLAPVSSSPDKQAAPVETSLKKHAEESGNPEGRVLPPVHPPSAQPAASSNDPLEAKRPLPELPPMQTPEKITGTGEPDPQNNPSVVTPEILERAANSER